MLFVSGACIKGLMYMYVSVTIPSFTATHWMMLRCFDVRLSACDLDCVRKQLVNVCLYFIGLKIRICL